MVNLLTYFIVQIGTDLQYSFISLFAWINVVASLMFLGAWFQILLVLMQKLLSPILVLALSLNSLTDTGRSLLVSSPSCFRFLFSFIGYAGSCIDFQASVSLISVASLFTEGILSCVSISFIGFLSFSVTPDRALRSLFCVICSFLSLHLLFLPPSVLSVPTVEAHIWV